MSLRIVERTCDPARLMAAYARIRSTSECLCGVTQVTLLAPRSQRFLIPSQDLARPTGAADRADLRISLPDHGSSVRSPIGSSCPISATARCASPGRSPYGIPEASVASKGPEFL